MSCSRYLRKFIGKNTPTPSTMTVVKNLMLCTLRSTHTPLSQETRPIWEGKQRQEAEEEGLLPEDEDADEKGRRQLRVEPRSGVDLLLGAAPRSANYNNTVVAPTLEVARQAASARAIMVPSARRWPQS
ncbi:hypothetical protein PR202_ga10793 [Eleusine coracana subsp. coracana]|uniref:Uncharacterized protein n=1 Tax=Eleusine coracana subsp. coracana TaxID=191504 RepID=A0AAV5C7U9_ELECO|nr:hypothetical protein PR202_ga10793 [Eleusine coracana subsp. coracana]